MKLPLERMLKRKSHFVWEGGKPYSYGKVADRNLRGERMTCSAYVPQMQDEGVYYYANPIPDQPARPRRRRSERRAPVGREDAQCIRPVSRDGVQSMAALMMLAALFFVLCIPCLVSWSQLIEAGDKVSTLQDNIQAVTQRNEDLEIQLALSAAEVNVSYEAVQMGMISARGVDVIYLQGPENADMILTPGEGGFVAEHLATILGN